MSQPIEIPIQRFSKKGNGIGNEKRPNGDLRTVEVPFAVPGDVVKATIYRKKSGKAKARLEEIVQPSEERITPRCVHFGVCGGCRLQQLPYAAQLRYKEEMVKALFGDLLTDDVEYRQIIPSDSQWHYRNKMEYSFSMNAAGEKFLGLVMEGGKNRVLNLQECHLVAPWFTQCLDAVRKWWEASNLHAFHPYKNTGTLRTLILREGVRTGDRMVMLTVSSNPDYAPAKSQLNNFIDAIREAVEPENGQGKLSIFIRIQQTAKGMATNFYEMLVYGPDVIREEMFIELRKGEPKKKFLFHISPASFFQPNPQQAEILYSHALQIADIQPDEIIYDLYCGTGTIGICAAGLGRQVYGIEVSPEAALDGRTNIKLNGLENVKIFAGAVHQVLDQVRQESGGRNPDVVIIDPPRAGLESVGQKLLPALQSSRILYISCNPDTMAADIRALKSAGYTLKILQPVDMFPHTMHVENIALLIRQ